MISQVEFGVLIFLAIAVSFDGLSVGITYGLRNIKIGLLSLLIISGLSTGAIFISTVLGNMATNIFQPAVTSIIGGLILVIMGAWLVVTAVKDKNTKNIKKSKKNKAANDEIKEVVFSINFRFFGIIVEILKNPTIADFDSSGSISLYEAFVLGCALGLDALGAGLGAGLTGTSILFFPFLVGLCKIIFVSTGFWAGQKVGDFLPSQFKIYPGIIIIIAGLFTILY